MISNCFSWFVIQYGIKPILIIHKELLTKLIQNQTVPSRSHASPPDRPFSGIKRPEYHIYAEGWQLRLPLK